MQPMFANFVVASFMVGLTIRIHFVGLLALMWLLRTRGHHFRAHESVVLDRRLRLVGAIEGANGLLLFG